VTLLKFNFLTVETSEPQYSLTRVSWEPASP